MKFFKELMVLNKRIKNISIIAALSVVLSAAVVFGGYRYYKSQEYNKLLNKAAQAAEKGNYEEGKGYLDTILKLDGENEKAKSLKEKYSENIKDKKYDNTSINNKSTENTFSNVKNDDKNTQISPQKAIEIVSKSVGNIGKKSKFEFDHEDRRDNIDYYVIHGFDSMEDHVATIGWYYVDKSSGKAYEWNLVENKLTPLN